MTDKKILNDEELERTVGGGFLDIIKKVGNKTNKEYKELSDDELESATGGDLTEAMLVAVNKLIKAANQKFEMWIALNPGATQKEQQSMLNTFISEVYESMSEVDKKLVDNYIAEVSK